MLACLSESTYCRSASCSAAEAVDSERFLLNISGVRMLPDVNPYAGDAWCDWERDVSPDVNNILIQIFRILKNTASSIINNIASLSS